MFGLRSDMSDEHLITSRTAQGGHALSNLFDDGSHIEAGSSPMLASTSSVEIRVCCWPR